MSKTKDPDQRKSRLEWLEEGSAAPEVAERLRNLCVLAVGLRQLSEWPEYKHFSMRDYAVTYEDTRMGREYYSLLNPLDIPSAGPVTFPGVGCNTVACALGHGPMFGIQPSHYLLPDSRELWSLYSLKFTESESDAYAWFFGGGWTHVEGHDTPLSAAKRIAYWIGSPAASADHRIVDFMRGLSMVGDFEVQVENYNYHKVYDSDEEVLRDFDVEMDALGFEGIIARMKAVLTEEQLAGIVWTDWEAQEKDLQKFTVKNHE